MLSAGSLQGCVLRPLLFMLLTHDCVSRYEGNLVIKFEDDITVVGLICRNDESMYRKEVERLVGWCRVNNLEDTDPARSSQYQRLPSGESRRHQVLRCSDLEAPELGQEHLSDQKMGPAGTG